MAEAPPIQDMPPSGGYSKINYERVPPKKLFTGIKLIAAYLVVQFGAIYYKLNYDKPKKRREELEMRSARIAVSPFMTAERDRAALLQLIKIRNEEADLMKDVKDWEVGKWNGEPIFKTLPEGTWVTPHQQEYFAHSDPSYYDTFRNIILRR